MINAERSVNTGKNALFASNKTLDASPPLISNGHSSTMPKAASTFSKSIGIGRESLRVYMAESLDCPVVGVLDEPYTQLCKPAQLSSHTGPPGYIGWTRFQPMYCIDWRACTATPLSGVS
jgi:hypothetical protein